MMEDIKMNTSKLDDLIDEENRKAEEEYAWFKANYPEFFEDLDVGGDW